MSNTPAQGVSSDPLLSKRVWFYKSGDYKFSGHRMVINARTFKTFDALLDTLSRKVPLPFGVRTITTPRGSYLVRGLDDLQDGESYVCSDQKRVKPLNLDEVNRQQVPWNTTRPPGAARQRHHGIQLRQSGRRKEATNRPAKITERVVVRTPKRLTVIKNKDPTVKSTIVLQRRTAPTFDALLDYLSQILQFPVLKLYCTDGRRVDGLAALILCSGVIVAAGNESFRLGNHSFYKSGQMAQAMFMETVEPLTLQRQAYNNKPFSNGRAARNFSQSSERYIVNQVNNSRKGGMNNDLHHDNKSFEQEVNQRQTSMETCGTTLADNDQYPCIVPHDDDIEKSFCVNQDGSMTVEMKVRLTIKEEEMLHWTTTLSRSSLSKNTVCPLVSQLVNSSPDSNNAVAKNSSSSSEDEAKEENHPAVRGRGVDLNDEQSYKGYTSTGLERAKPCFKRTPTPGPQHVKKTSIESVKKVTESEVQESTMGHYSYMAKTADGGTTEGHCVVRHSSSSTCPIPKPQKTALAGANNKGSHSSMKSTGVAEVLQIENNGMEVRETVMHIYETQGCCDNYFANEECNVDRVPLHGSSPVPESKLLTDSGSLLSTNDCDIDSTWQPPIVDSLQRQKEDIFSLSSEPVSPTHTITNDLSSMAVNEAPTATTSPIKSKRKVTIKDNAVNSEKRKRVIKPSRKQENSPLTSNSEKKQKESIITSSKNRKKLSSEKLGSKVSVGKKSLTSSESAKSGQKSKEKPQMKKFSMDKKTPNREKALLANVENVKKTTPKNTNKTAPKDNGHNVNTSETKAERSQMKNISDFFQPKRSSLVEKKTVSKPKLLPKNRKSPSKKSLELNESVSMPSPNPSRSEIQQYVENWLEKVSPDRVPYTEETTACNSEPPKKVVFQIGDASESEEKSSNRSNPEEYSSSPNGAAKKSNSSAIKTAKHNRQDTRDLCASMPSIKEESQLQESRLRSNKSGKTIGPVGKESPSSKSLSPKAKIKPVLQQICSSLQCIRRASDMNMSSNLEKSNSSPSFPSQVASVFGLPCKALLSFLSVMTMQDSLMNETGNGSSCTSEAMLMMESLQKISTMGNKEEQRLSLTELHHKASSQFQTIWKDFQIMREQFASEWLDVSSEGGSVFHDQLGIDELIDEFNMPQDIREEITLTIQQAKNSPTAKGTFAEIVENHSDSEKDLDELGKGCKEELYKSPKIDSTCVDENTNNIMSDIDQKSDQIKETDLDANESDIRDKTLKDKENEMEGKEEENQVDEVEEERDEGNVRLDEGAEVGEENGSIKEEGCEETQETVKEKKNEEDVELIEKVEDGTEEKMTEDKGKDNLGGEIEEVEEIDDGLRDKEDEEARQEQSLEETDDREASEESVTQESDEEKEAKTKDVIGEMEKGTEDGSEERNEEELTENKGEKDEEERTEDAREETRNSTGERGREERTKNAIQAMVEEEEGTKESFEKRNEKEPSDEDQAVEDRVEETENLSEKRFEEENVEDEEAERQDVTEDEETKNSVVQRDEESSEEEETESVLGEEVEEDKSEQTVGRDEEHETENAIEERDEVQETQGNIEESDEEDEIGYVSGERDVGEEKAEVLSRESEDEEGEESENRDSVEYRDEDSVGNNAQNNKADLKIESPTKYSSESQCAEEKGSGTDAANQFETDEDAEVNRESPSSLPHPVEISQELLEFVNSILQFSSLIFTYDSQGNIRIEADPTRTVQKQTAVQKNRKVSSSYGLKCLPSPSTSDLSDYRPESSESGGYKTQDSLDIITESGDEASGMPFPMCRHSVHKEDNGTTNIECVNSNLSTASESKSANSFNSKEPRTKASREDLSYFSAASSLKADNEPATEAAQCKPFFSESHSSDGVLIDQGRWLLKENHLIRKSPPVSMGMYGNLDNTSIDSPLEDSPTHSKMQHSLLAAISSSELEEMAKPQTPKCTYYNMPHGSDSDPFVDDISVKSGKKGTSSFRGRGIKVSPIVDTSKTWANKNGSLSSFASVEFKIPDTKVHPEGESSALTQATRTSSAGGSALQAQDSLETLHLRCGQYCPIL